MAILLSWKNNNPPQNVLRIYRSETTFDTANLPAPLATLPGDAKSYTDTTAVGAKSYSYLLQVSNGQEVVYSKTPTITHIKNRGPGPQMLQQGDYDCGYFGEVSADELPSVFAAFGVAPGYIGTLNNYPSVYHKFAWKGRILYYGAIMLSAVQVYGSSRNKLTRSGLVYNFTNAALQATVQNVHSKNGFSFHARCPRSTPENWDGTTSPFTKQNLENPDTEFNQILGSLMRVAPPGKRKLSRINTTIFSSTVPQYGVAIADPPIGAMGSNLSRISTTNYSLKFLPVAISNGKNPQEFEVNSTTTAGWYATSDSAASSKVWPVFELIEQ